MRTTLSLAFVLCASIVTHASYLPYFDDIRAVIVDRQLTISNAPPIDAAGKKELNVLKVALKTIDKPSTSLKSDLTALAKVVAGVNKGASNGTFSFEFSTAISNFVAVLGETNDVLQAQLANATNNYALKQKAQDALDNAANALVAINPETDLNAGAKSLGAVLKLYGIAGKAVTTAVNAKPAPVPAPKLGTAVVEAAGHVYVVQCVSPTRNSMGSLFTGNDGLLNLTVNIAGNQGPGTYQAAFTVIKVDGGVTNTITLQSDTANITAASSKAMSGNFSGQGYFTVYGQAPQLVPVSIRFAGKFLFQLP